MTRITGLNHFVLVCKDMKRTLDFYVNILGLKLKATGQQSVALSKHVHESAHAVKRIYFLEMADGSCITFAELPAAQGRAESSLFTPNYWPGSSNTPRMPSKVDHIALNVDSKADLVYFQQRLREHGVEVSDIYERDTDPKFVKSIYFYDPDGIPLEIATWDFGDPNWEHHREDNYFRDPDPVEPGILGSR